MRGNYSEEALAAYAELVAASAALDFSEDNTYDFTRCVRPDGSAYGTRGRCKKGTESAKEAAKPAATRSGSRGPADHAGRVAKHEGEYNKHAAAHKAAKEELKGHKGRDLAARVKRQQLAYAVQALEDKRDMAHDKLMKAKRGLFAADEKAKRKPKGVTSASDLAGQHHEEMGVSRAKLEKAYAKMLKANPDMDLGDLYMKAQGALKGKGKP